MEDENLLVMLESAVGEAVDALSTDPSFVPFAYALDLNNEVMAFNSDTEDTNEAYENLWQRLKEAAGQERIRALVLLQVTQIPESFNIEGSFAIRVHVEHSENREEKIAGRYLYIPYQRIVMDDKEVEVKLFKPEPIAFANEIFLAL